VYKPFDTKLFWYSFLVTGGLAAAPELVDEIVAKLPHADGDILIYASDRRDIEGRARTLLDVILDGVMEVKARDHLKQLMLPSEVTPENIIKTLEKRYNITREQLFEIFEQQGYATEEIADLLKRRHFVDALISSSVHGEEPSKEAISAYYQKDPDYEMATYTVQLASIPTDEMTQAELDELLATGKEVRPVRWQAPETYQDADLHESQEFIRTMAVGSVQLMGEIEGSYDLVKLVNKVDRVAKPLDEALLMQRSMQLRQKLFNEELRKFQKKLLEKAKIIFCRPIYAEQFQQEFAAKFPDTVSS